MAKRERKSVLGIRWIVTGAAAVLMAAAVVAVGAVAEKTTASGTSVTRPSEYAAVSIPPLHAPPSPSVLPDTTFPTDGDPE